MYYKNLTITIVMALLCTGVLAQQKNIEHATDKSADVAFFQADPTIQPTSTSVIIYTTAGFNDSADKLIATLNKKGVAAVKITDTKTGIQTVNINKAFKYLQTNAVARNITAPEIGFVAIGGSVMLSSNLAPMAFIGLINPGEISKDHTPPTIPLFVDENSKNSEGALRLYSRWSKNGGKNELHLHQQSVNDSIQTAELLNWMAGLNLLKPISNEKTGAQKKQEDWANFLKSVDDRLHNDWAWLKRYEADNDKMPAPAKNENRVVFLGNSITEGWINKDPEFFQSHGYINRGIGGQTTPQMLVRFREDVVNLHPQLVIILAGINDIAGNTGPSRLENIAGNIISMAEIAKANGIKVILCSVLPALAFPWHPGIDPVSSILKLNAMLKSYAEKNKLEYADYYSAVVDEKQGFKKELVIDGVHPNLQGYKVMEPIAESVIKKALPGK